jgi:hypothetical protein
MKFGAVYSESTVLPISRQILRSLYNLRSELRRALSHWNEKVGYISEEITNGPKFYFTPSFRSEYGLLSEAVKNYHITRGLSLSPSVVQFLKDWIQKEKM